MSDMNPISSMREPIGCVKSCEVCPAFPDCLSLAMAYVPAQRFDNLYEPETGFERGTVFKGLDLPLLGKAVDA